MSNNIVSKYLIVKKFIFVSGLLAILFFSGCGSSVRVFHDLDPDAAFGQYMTYSFLDWTDGNIRTISDIDREKIRVAIAREVEAKGYTFQEGDSDVKIQITVYFRNAGHHYHHYYGFPGMAYNFMERTIAVDMFEGGSKDHIWHSAAIGNNFNDPREWDDELPEISMKLFEDYPVRQGI